MVELIQENLILVIISILAVLAILVVAVISMAVKLNRIKGEEAQEKEQAFGHPEVSLDISPSDKENYEEEDEEEIVAAIIAAICAYSGMSAKEFTIKSIRIINSGNSEWRRQGLIP